MKKLQPIFALCLSVCLCACFVTPAHGQSDAPDAEQADSKTDKTITVSVLPFATPEGEEKTGEDVGEIISLLLSAEPGFRVVEREALDLLTQELGLSLTGLVDTADAVKVGKLIGADIIIVGRVFELGSSRMMTAKLIGSETSLIDGAVERGKLDSPIDELVFALSEKAVTALRERGAGLLPDEAPTDPALALIEKLKGAKLPAVAVVVREQERDNIDRGEAPDPAVETEIKRVLIEAGITVKDVPHNELAEWVEADAEAGRQTWPRSLDGVGLVITGEGFSELGGSIGSLRIAIARAEINAIDRQTGEIVVAQSATARSVDLAPGPAGKSALEKAGRQLSLHILEYLVSMIDEPAPEQ